MNKSDKLSAGMKYFFDFIFLPALQWSKAALPASDSVELKQNKPCRFELVLVLVVTAFWLGAGQDQHRLSFSCPEL